MPYFRSIHPFPARMAPEIALGALEGLPPGSSVLDPMCGSGMVVRRALDCGHKGVGLDIDPLATLMARVWTTETSQSIKSNLGFKIAVQAKTLLDSSIDLPWIDNDLGTTEYVNFWFAPTQRKQIRALLGASDHLRGQRKDLFRLALSRVIITKSGGASRAADVSHSRPHRVKQDNDFDVFSGFSKSFERLMRVLRESPVPANGRIRCGDARTLRGIRSESIDAVVTSPPYMNAIDYLRGHKLALVWLGFGSSQIRTIKSRGIGAPTKTHESHSKRLNAIVQETTEGAVSPYIERVVGRYVQDMMACLRQTHRVLRPNGYAVYVVSNSSLRGTEIDISKIIVEVASESGLRLEDSYVRDIPSQHRYLPPPQATSNPQLATRMKTESVLRFRKFSTD